MDGIFSSGIYGDTNELIYLDSAYIEKNQFWNNYFDFSSNAKFYKSGDLIIMTGFDIISKSTSSMNSSSSDPWYFNPGTICMAKIRNLENINSFNTLHLLNASGNNYYHFVCNIRKENNEVGIYCGSGLSFANIGWFGSVNVILL